MIHIMLGMILVIMLSKVCSDMDEYRKFLPWGSMNNTILEFDFSALVFLNHESNEGLVIIFINVHKLVE